MRFDLYSRLSFAILFAIIYPILLAGCEESIVGSQASVQPTFASIQQNVFARSCASMSCHSTLSQRGGLVLEAGKAYANLVGVSSDNESAKAQGLKRVNPGKPDSSFLMIKLTGPGPGQGTQMPDGNDPLSQQAIGAIRTWIANGAPQN